MEVKTLENQTVSPASQVAIKNLAVVGLGYVGLPLALLADKKGLAVTGIDIDESKVEKINKKIAPFFDNEIEKYLKNSRLTASTDFAQAAQADVVVICVPTPVNEDRTPNLRPVIGAASGIAPFLRRGQLIVLESTVNPGVCDEIVLPILEAQSNGLKAGVDFYLAHCPERIDPGNESWNVQNIPRVVGSMEPNGLEIALAFYRSIIDADIKPMGSLKEAEAVKVVENSFRDINIAFVNELAMSFHRLGIDVTRVIDGAATKPFSFLPHFPGCGVGGHCIPVDPHYLIDYARQNGFDHEFLSMARRINSQMPKYVSDLLVESLRRKSLPIAGTKVAVLGLAYKANIGDDRESPSYEIIRHLKEENLDVAPFDPYVAEKSGIASLREALAGAKAALVATAHREFLNITPRDFQDAGVEIIIDGRNCLDKQALMSAGLIYQGVGR